MHTYSIASKVKRCSASVVITVRAEKNKFHLNLQQFRFITLLNLYDIKVYIQHDNIRSWNSYWFNSKNFIVVAFTKTVSDHKQSSWHNHVGHIYISPYRIQIHGVHPVNIKSIRISAYDEHLWVFTQIWGLYCCATDTYLQSTGQDYLTHLMLPCRDKLKTFCYEALA